MVVPPGATTTDLDLRPHGLIKPGPVYARLGPAALTELALRHHEGHLTDRGALAAYTGSRTGRSPRATPGCSTSRAVAGSSSASADRTPARPW